MRGAPFGQRGVLDVALRLMNLEHAVGGETAWTFGWASNTCLPTAPALKQPSGEAERQVAARRLACVDQTVWVAAVRFDVLEGLRASQTSCSA